ncbi:hypothetical protein D3C78_981870 [compost metagenome]
MGRYPVGRQLVVAGHVLDGQKLILGGHLRHRDQLHPVLLAVWRVEQQVAEIARAFALFERLAQRHDVRLVVQRVGHIHDETGMTTVLVVFAPKQGRRLVEQGGVHRRHIVGDSIDLLVDVALLHLADAIGRQFKRLARLGYPPILLGQPPPPHVLGMQVLIAQRSAQPVADFPQVAVAKHQKVHHQRGELGQWQLGVRDETGAQDVALDLDGRGVVHRRPVDPRQAHQGEGRLIPAPVPGRFQVVEQLALGQHRHRFAKGKGLDRGLRRGRHRMIAHW